MHTVYVEPNNGGGAYRKAMEPVFRKMNVRANLVDDDWSSGQKEARIIDQLLPVLGTHKLVVSRSVAKDNTWAHQLSHLLYQKGCLPHDDRIDSTWGVVKKLNHWIEADTVDEDPEAYKMERLKKAHAEYWGESPIQESHVLGRYGISDLGL